MNTILSFLVLILIIGLYFLPLIIAWQGKAPNVGSVAVVNIFLGWTFIGWIVAMAMAMRDPRPRPPMYGPPPGYFPPPPGYQPPPPPPGAPAGGPHRD